MNKLAKILILLIVAITATTFAVVNTNNKKTIVNVAIVNEDQKVEKNGKEYYYGKNVQSVIEELNSEVQYQVTTRQNATDGLNEGKFDLMIIIPSTYTKNIISFDSENFVSGEIQYRKNANISQNDELKNTIITEKIDKKIDEAIIKTYTIDTMSTIKSIQENNAELIKNEEEYAKEYGDKVDKPLATTLSEINSLLSSISSDQSSVSNFGQSTETFKNTIENQSQIAQKNLEAINKINNDLSKLDTKLKDWGTQSDAIESSIKDINASLEIKIQALNSLKNQLNGQIKTISDIKVELGNEKDRVGAIGDLWNKFANTVEYPITMNNEQIIAKFKTETGCDNQPNTAPCKSIINTVKKMKIMRNPTDPNITLNNNNVEGIQKGIVGETYKPLSSYNIEKSGSNDELKYIKNVGLGMKYIFKFQNAANVAINWTSPLPNGISVDTKTGDNGYFSLSVAPNAKIESKILNFTSSSQQYTFSIDVVSKEEAIVNAVYNANGTAKPGNPNDLFVKYGEILSFYGKDGNGESNLLAKDGNDFGINHVGMLLALDNSDISSAIKNIFFEYFRSDYFKESNYKDQSKINKLRIFGFRSGINSLLSLASRSAAYDQIENEMVKGVSGVLSTSYNEISENLGDQIKALVTASSDLSQKIKELEQNGEEITNVNSNIDNLIKVNLANIKTLTTQTVTSAQDGITQSKTISEQQLQSIQASKTQAETAQGLVEQTKQVQETSKSRLEGSKAVVEKASTNKKELEANVGKINELVKTNTEKAKEYEAKYNAAYSGETQNKNYYGNYSNPSDLKNNGESYSQTALLAFYIVILMSFLSLLTAHIFANKEARKINLSEHKVETRFTYINKTIPKLIGVSLVISGILSFYVFNQVDTVDKIRWFALIPITMVAMTTLFYGLLLRFNSYGLYAIIGLVTVYIFNNGGVGQFAAQDTKLAQVQQINPLYVLEKTIRTILTSSEGNIIPLVGIMLLVIGLSFAFIYGLERKEKAI